MQTRTHTRATAAVAATLSCVLALSACGGSSGEDGEATTLRLWHYETADSAMGAAWDEAIKVFEEEHPGVTVEFERKAYEQISQSAGMILGSGEAPDIMEYDKGNANVGLLSNQGLLTDLTDVVTERGWDDIISPSLATTAQYENGLMGSGPWYGVTNYGEYSMVYYNKDLFAQYDLDVPTTFDEFETVMQTFADEGITPIATAGSEYPIMELFYDLSMLEADTQFVRDYQFFEGDVDFHGPEFSSAAATLDDWVTKGFISSTATSMTAEDMGVSFINGSAPMMVSGSWWFGRLKSDVQFDWDSFLFPGADSTAGSSGNLWVVPESSEAKDLAYDFIDITLRPEIQSIIGNTGGLPVNADTSEITDERDQRLIENFNDLLDRDGLAYYMAWPVAGFSDTLTAGMQSLLNQSKPAGEVLDSFGAFYEQGKTDMGVE